MVRIYHKISANSNWKFDSCVIHLAGDPVVVVILIFHPDKVCSPPDFRDVLPKWYGFWGHRNGGNSGSVGIMEAMAILLDAGAESLETTMGTVGVGWGSMGSAMMGHCWCWVAWSDWIDCFNLMMGLGMARSSISKSEGSSNTDLRASGSDMMIEGYVLKAVWMMIVGWKMEIHGRIGSQCLNMRIRAESEVEHYSMLNWCMIPGISLISSLYILEISDFHNLNPRSIGNPLYSEFHPLEILLACFTLTLPLLLFRLCSVPIKFQTCGRQF